MRLLGTWLVASLAAVTTTQAQSSSGNSCGGAMGVQTIPAAPKQGTFFRVRVTNVPAIAQLGGEAGPNALHFRRLENDSGFLAFAGIGTEARRSDIVVRCSTGDGTEIVTHRVTATPGAYPTERLRVNPSFSAKPDSALAVRLERESERARAVAELSHATPPLWSADFAPPRESRVTSGYGRGRVFNGQLTSRHLGTDFAGATGAPVSAVNRGIVRIVDAFFYGGNVVYLDHGAGISTAYLHLSRQLVQVGDTVERGQVIGEVGATGRVTGPHLHLISRLGTMSLDPLTLFRRPVVPRPAPRKAVPRRKR